MNMISLTGYCWIILWASMWMQLIEAGCGKQNFTDDYGTASCSNKEKKDFDWVSHKSVLLHTSDCVFSPPNNTQYDLFVVKFIHYSIYGNNINNYQVNVSLPDANRSSQFSIIPNRNYWNNWKPWCGIYAKANSNSGLTCNLNATMNGICNKSIVTVLQWPPEIGGTLSNFRVMLLYEHLSCAELAALLAATATTKTAMPSSPNALSIVFGLLLAATCTAWIITLCKQRKSSSNNEASPQVDLTAAHAVSGEAAQGNHSVNGRYEEPEYNLPFDAAAHEAGKDSSADHTAVYAQISRSSDASFPCHDTPVGQVQTHLSEKETVENPLYASTKSN